MGLVKGGNMVDAYDEKWWLRVADGKVIRAHEAKASERLGPYDTPEEAANGLAALHSREERLSEEDREWRDGDDRSGASE
ncbi:hypothetical protein [Cumulibacter soli]|uniref:hypothetical protein n=1 Tax=Cumulibacter soli TaxID=2546344 RepID=UPI00106883B7|nr:hypothetical protein [Cumulibacter soli]